MTRSPTLVVKSQALLVTGAGRVEPDGQEWRIIDPDSPFFDRGHQIIMTVFITAQDGSEQPHQRFALNGRSFMMPNAVTGDAQVHIAEQGGIPAIYRRQGSVGV